MSSSCKQNTLSFILYTLLLVCTQTFIVNLPTATFNEGEEVGSLSSPAKGCFACFINSLQHKEHLQVRQAPPASPSLSDTSVYYGNISLTYLIDRKNSNFKIGFKSKTGYGRFEEL